MSAALMSAALMSASIIGAVASPDVPDGHALAPVGALSGMPSAQLQDDDLPFPWVFEGTLQNSSTFANNFGAQGTFTLVTEDNSLVVTLSPDGSAEATVTLSSRSITVDCSAEREGEIREDQVPTQPVTLRGSHSGGQVSFPIPGADSLSGSYDANAMALQYNDGGTVPACDSSRTQTYDTVWTANIPRTSPPAGQRAGQPGVTSSPPTLPDQPGAGSGDGAGAGAGDGNGPSTEVIVAIGAGVAVVVAAIAGGAIAIWGGGGGAAITTAATGTAATGTAATGTAATSAPPPRPAPPPDPRPAPPAPVAESPPPPPVDEPAPPPPVVEPPPPPLDEAPPPPPVDEPPPVAPPSPVAGSPAVPPAAESPPPPPVTEPATPSAPDSEPPPATDPLEPPPNPGIEVVPGGPGTNPLAPHTPPGGPGRCVVPGSPNPARAMMRFGLPRHVVNLASLTLDVDDLIYAHGSFGPRVELRARYHGPGLATARPGLLGRGWRLDVDERAAWDGRRVRIDLGTGQVLRFVLDGDVDVDRPFEFAPLQRTPHRLLADGPILLLHDTSKGVTRQFMQLAGTTDHLLTARMDASGNGVTYSYGGDGVLESITDASGASTALEFDDAGHCIGFVVPDGRRASFGYDALGRLTSTIDLASVASSYDYDSSHPDQILLTRLRTSGGGPTIEFGWSQDSLGFHVTAESAGEGAVTRYTRSPDDPSSVVVTDPEGRSSRFESIDGRLRSVTGPMRETMSLMGDDRRLRVDGDLSPTQSIELTDDGEVRSDALGRQWRARRNGATSIFTDPDEGQWTYRMDRHIDIGEVTSPAGRWRRFRRDDRGQIVEVEGPRGTRTTFVRAADGNVTSVIDAIGATHVFERDVAGRIIAAVDPRNHRTEFSYDNNDRVTAVRQPDGSLRRYIHSCCDAIAEIDELGRRSEFRRDPLMRLGRVSRPGHHIEYEYDRSGQVAATLDAKGRRTALHRNASGHVIAVEDSAGGVVRYEVNPGGRLEAIVDRSGGRTAFHHDAVGNLVGETDPLGRRRTIDYDHARRVTRRRNARGQEVSFERDADGLLTSIDHDGVRVAELIRDAEGAVTQMSHPAGGLAIERDDVGRATRMSWGNGLTLALSYDIAGNCVAWDTPVGTVRYDYDARNRPISLSTRGTSIAFTYDAAGRLLREERSTGVTSHYTYDDQDNMERILHARHNEVIAELEIDVDETGNVQRERHRGITIPPSPPVLLNADYDAGGQILTKNGVGYGYDADGNLVSTADGSWHAEYDTRNRPTFIRTNGETITFAYDGEGRLAQVDHDSERRIRYHDDLGRLVMTSRDDNSDPELYLWLNRCLVGRVTGGEERVELFLFDHRGSTLGVTDASGDLTMLAFDPWGAQLLGDTSEPCGWGARFGIERIAHDVYRCGPRLYRVSDRRFAQRDPIGLAGGLNPYAYARNNPASRTDPSGLVGPLLAAAAAGIALITAAATARSTLDSATGRLTDAADLTATAGERNRTPPGQRTDIEATIAEQSRGLEQLTVGQIQRETLGDIAGNVADTYGGAMSLAGPLGPAGSALQAGEAMMSGNYGSAVVHIAGPAAGALEDAAPIFRGSRGLTAPGPDAPTRWWPSPPPEVRGAWARTRDPEVMGQIWDRAGPLGRSPDVLPIMPTDAGPISDRLVNAARNAFGEDLDSTFTTQPAPPAPPPDIAAATRLRPVLGSPHGCGLGGD